jgi:hypothetical protein
MARLVAMKRVAADIADYVFCSVRFPLSMLIAAAHDIGKRAKPFAV